MTLQDLKERIENEGLKYQYGFVEDNTIPPYLCAVVCDSNNFVADNTVYKKIDSIELYYTYKVKDLTIEETIENNVLYDLVWRKGDEMYNAKENVWQVVYYFNI